MKLSAVVAAFAAFSLSSARMNLLNRASSCPTLFSSERSFVQPLVTACNNAVTDKTKFWSNKVCIAAAVAASPANLRTSGSCASNAKTTSLPALSAYPSMDYNVYASIVGSCAWATGGCPITEQNFVDLMYNAIATLSNPVWPASVDVLLDYYIHPIFEWTATCDTVPYLNFNDWLHYSVASAHTVAVD